MTEGIEPRSDHATTAAERRAVESPPYDDRRSRAGSVLVWVGIVAGVIFIVAVTFFSGFFIGRGAGENRGYQEFREMMQEHHREMMGPGQMGPGQMGPGQMGPGQQPTTTAPTTPRP